MIAGALTTLATSAAEGDRIEAERNVLYTGGERAFVVRLSEDANESAAFIELQLSLPNFASDGAGVIIVPDSDELSPLVIEPSAGDAETPAPAPDAAAGDAAVPQVGFGYDLGQACPDEGPCELRFELRQYGASTRVRADVNVTVIAVAPTEPGLCSDQPEFPSSATIEIEREEP